MRVLVKCDIIEDMNINFLRIFGWVLLIAGLAVIIYCLYASYLIFTAKMEPPKFFTIQAVNTQNQLPSAVKPKTTSNPRPEDLLGGGIDINQLLGNSLNNLFPAGDMNRIMNLAVWSMFVAILFWGGGQIAGIGIKLLK